MSAGGARARAGRLPERAEQWVTLPAEGYQGPIPAFPLVAPSARETELWNSLWRTPQAAAWAHQEFEVVSYVRTLACAELPESKAAYWVLVRQLGESLGLSVSGMQRLRWRIADGEPNEPTAAPARVSAKNRMRAVN